MIASLIHQSCRTGRTQRMLEEAVRLAREHTECIVIVATDKQAATLARYLAAKFDGLVGQTGMSVRLSAQAWVYFKSLRDCNASPPSASLADGTVYGRPAPVLADHHVFEAEVRRQLGWAMDQWDRWTSQDNPHIKGEQ